MYHLDSLTKSNGGHEYFGEGMEHYAYYCGNCKGWIMGEPNDYYINNLAPEHLAGRRGHDYYCRRCGENVGFSGIVS